jgi:hypothetical protein
VKRTKKAVKASMQLDQLPDDEFMTLLDAVGDGPVVEGPSPSTGVVSYTPRRIRDEIDVGLVDAGIGDLLARARAETGWTLREVGRTSGVTYGRVQQLEKSTNIEIATLVRMAAALGYAVRIEFVPDRPGAAHLSAQLARPVAE